MKQVTIILIALTVVSAAPSFNYGQHPHIKLVPEDEEFKVPPHNFILMNLEKIEELKDKWNIQIDKPEGQEHGKIPFIRPVPEGEEFKMQFGHVPHNFNGMELPKHHFEMHNIGAYEYGKIPHKKPILEGDEFKMPFVQNPFGNFINRPVEEFSNGKNPFETPIPGEEEINVPPFNFILMNVEKEKLIPIGKPLAEGHEFQVPPHNFILPNIEKDKLIPVIRPVPEGEEFNVPPQNFILGK